MCLFIILKGKFPSEALYKAAQTSCGTRSAASCWTAKYLFHCGTKGTFVLWVCAVPRSASWFGFQFSGWRLRLCGLPEECVPRWTEPAVLEVRGQGNSQLSCQKTHKQINRTYDIRDSSIFIQFLTAWQLLWCSLFRLTRPCWCVQFFFLIFV